MVNVRYLNIVLLLLTTLLLQGCPRGVNTNLYNNSHKDLLIMSPDGKGLEWKSKTLFRLDGRDRWGTVRNEKGHTIPLLIVRDGVKLFNYELSFYNLKDEYIESSPRTTFTSGTIEYNLQLETDKQLYIVKSGHDFPLKDLYPQPLGFPIQAIISH